jgi:hypothetical protein
MRVNVYSEELCDRVEIIEKTIEGRTYTAVRFYLELPATVHVCRTMNATTFEPASDGFCRHCGNARDGHAQRNLSGPFEHRPGDDDSAAVTFWGKRDLRKLLAKALELLDEHYAAENRP